MTRRWWWITALLTTGACSGADPGIVKNDCPGTPKIVSLDQPAPYWDGLERVHFTVPGGMPDSIQVETFNPALGTWTGFPTTFLEQEDDNTYVSSASINPTDDSKDASYKLRIRALLDSCPPSDWATTAPFTVGDPLSDTSWKAHVDTVDVSFFLQATVTMGVGTSTGPYELAAGGIDHTMQFHANGAFDEIWDFGIESAHAGDLYKGCKFSLHYTGQWHWSFSPTFRLVLGTRSPAPAALTGSTCASPALTELAINQAGFVDDVQPSQLFPNVDYSRLIHVTPGKAIWQETQVITRLGQAMHGLSDTVGADQVSLFGSISFGGANVSYIKQ